MYLLRELTGLSLIKIGEHFNRDHTTALHGIKKIEALMPARGARYRQVQELTKKIRARSRGPVNRPRILGIHVRGVGVGSPWTTRASAAGSCTTGHRAVHSARVSFLAGYAGQTSGFPRFHMPYYYGLKKSPDIRGAGGAL